MLPVFFFGKRIWKITFDGILHPSVFGLKKSTWVEICFHQKWFFSIFRSKISSPCQFCDQFYDRFLSTPPKFRRKFDFWLWFLFHHNYIFCKICTSFVFVFYFCKKFFGTMFYFRNLSVIFIWVTRNLLPAKWSLCFITSTIFRKFVENLFIKLFKTNRVSKI